MGTRNSDLLPPLFDQVLTDSGETDVGAHVREDIIRSLETAIVNAAAAREREEALRTMPSGTPRAPDAPVVLTTSDRLSGEDIARTEIVDQLQRQTGLNADVLEIGLLLIEAQIDLRLKGARSFTIAGLTFSSGEHRVSEDDTKWCTSVLSGAVQAAAQDRPSPWPLLGKRRPPGIRVLMETIQLSAAQRDALPYHIKVERSRIEPLLTSPRGSEAIRVLQVSDLHLIGDLAEEGRKLAKPFGTPSHSFSTARLVSNAVRELSPTYDLLVATGDLSTDGTRESFDTVLQYVQSGTISGANPMRIAAYGLGAPKSRRILLPGNHDRYAGKLVIGQRMSDLFEQTLGTPASYPYAAGFRPDRPKKDGLTLICFVFDSTLPEGREGLDFARAAAVGRIGDEELSRFEELAQRVATDKRVDALAGEPLDIAPENTVRVALLHHHPIVTHFETELATRRSWFRQTEEVVRKYRNAREAELVQMKNADAFLRACFRAGIQLVLFGHQHYTYRRAATYQGGADLLTPFGTRKGVMRAFCCPTTLQYDEKCNGFYVYDVLDRGRVQWTLTGAMRNGESLGPMKELASGTVELDAPLTTEEQESIYSLN